MKNWKIIAIAAVGVVFFILACVFGVQGSQNKAIAMEQAIETAMSDIKVQEQSRMSKLPNMVDCVKQYDKHEAATLQAIVDGRSGGSKNIDNFTATIAAVAEAYPELKSNENYQTLMKEIATIENLLSQYRTNYNKQVGKYNSYVEGFPTRIFLSWTGYEPVDFKRLDYGAPVDAPTGLFED